MDLMELKSLYACFSPSIMIQYNKTFHEVYNFKNVNAYIYLKPLDDRRQGLPKKYGKVLISIRVYLEKDSRDKRE